MKKANDPSKFESVVEGIIAKYIADFWDDETEIALIQSEVGPIFSAGGGLNKKMKDELSADFRLQILQYTQALLQSLQKQYIYKARKELSQQFASLANDLNDKQTLRCQILLDKNEKPDEYKGLKVMFKVAGKEMVKMWQGALNQDAMMDFKCTRAGYIGAGLPTQATLFVPINDEKKEYEKIKQSFKLNPIKNFVPIKFKVKKELADGPWEISEYEAPELFDGLDNLGAYLKASAKEKKAMDEANRIKRAKAVRKIEDDYNKTLSSGSVNAPSAKYEKLEDLMFLKKYNPKKAGNLYSFTVVQDGNKFRFLLDLKSETYFEAKIFTNTNAVVCIEYIKGNLKK